MTSPALCRNTVVEAVHRSWWNVDRDYGTGGELYFTEYGVCAMPGMTMRGRAEIAEGYAQRQAKGPRLSRHLISNVVTDIDGQRASALYLLSLYAGTGIPPLSVESPSAICDVEDRLVYSDGRWLIEHRHLVPIFVAAGNDSVMLRGEGSHG